MNQILQYRIVKNDRNTCDLLALNSEGTEVLRLDDVSRTPEPARRVAELYTANKLPLYQLEEVTSHLLGALL